MMKPRPSKHHPTMMRKSQPKMAKLIPWLLIVMTQKTRITTMKLIDCDDAKDMHNDDPQPHNEATSLKTPPEDEKESTQNGQTETIVIDCDDTKGKNNDDSKQKCCGIGCVKFLKIFGKSVAAKKSIYLSLIPHLFDQGTDFGVIWQYYALSKTEVSPNINYSAFFYCSIAVISVHKLITCSVVWTLTESIRDV
eukprot:1112881_1